MTLPDFLTALEQELRLTGRPFDRGALIAFAESVFVVALEDPGDVPHWAGEFLAANGPATNAGA
jgi:hypothetical protein